MAKKSQGDGCAFYAAINKHRFPGEKDFALSKRIGIRASTLDGWKLGRCPRITTLFEVARGLKIDPVELLKDCLEIPGAIE